MAIEEKKFLGAEGTQRLIANIRGEFEEADTVVLGDAKKYADDLGVNYDSAGTAATKMQELADGQVKTNKDAIGTMDNLQTTAKGDLVTAINEVRNAVSAGGTAAAITMSEETSNLGDGVAKAYVLKQGDNTVGTINIPKDMVVQSGEVVTNPEGQAAGTYIKLVLANATNDVIYVNAGTLVDIYKAKADAAQVQLAIDSSSREISASIMTGSVTATELATDAVITAKIADGNVTKGKLSTEVQASLDKADVALSEAKAYADSKVAGVDLSGIATNASDIDKLEASLAEGGATANAIVDAKKAGTDASAAVTALEEGEVADLRTDVDALKSVTYVAITADEIDAMFQA